MLCSCYCAISLIVDRPFADTKLEVNGSSRFWYMKSLNALRVILMLLFLTPHVACRCGHLYDFFICGKRDEAIWYRRPLVHLPCDFEDIIIPRASWGGSSRSQWNLFNSPLSNYGKVKKHNSSGQPCLELSTHRPIDNRANHYTSTTSTSDGRICQRYEEDRCDLLRSAAS